eukprot:CAMPEP_0174742446 /NCGR_PEP_ID=MMETSP1094-20130205/78907_1 /TAXON_ID=156173 /ORGANISM="Chrysochromulina brevifilum, Strain UTEX LB 985" /LENGTH=81 /DNA_ID=CAMNT_0015946501 /DNA_START=25 /DNA_END=266 /DNA_ORIENTATION=+
MGGKPKNRSLASRKRAKDVSMAMLDNVFRKGEKHLAEPPKADADDKMSRGAREMQRNVKYMLEREAGIAKPRPIHREDLPR